MLHRIYRWFFPAPTVASIMSSFTKQIDQLRCVECDCETQEAVLREQIEIANANLTATSDERVRAQRAAAKLQSFLDD